MAVPIPVGKRNDAEFFRLAEWSVKVAIEARGPVEAETREVHFGVQPVNAKGALLKNLGTGAKLNDQFDLAVPNLKTCLEDFAKRDDIGPEYAAALQKAGGEIEERLTWAMHVMLFARGRVDALPPLPAE